MDQFSSLNNVNRATRDSMHTPYVQVFAALQETRTWDSAFVNKVLDLMSNGGLPLNLPTLNILLSREVSTLGESSFCHSMIKEPRISKKISPDSFTFGRIFLLYRMIRNDHRKNLASPFPPRALYLDFNGSSETEFNADRIVSSTTLMNAILRAFVFQRDYGGAFVVLRSFSFSTVPSDSQTYHLIFKHVVRRIWLEVSK